jgi:hypothetical protein
MKHPRASMAPTFSRLHLAVTSIDETRLTATVRVSGHNTCFRLRLDGSRPLRLPRV